LALGVLGMVPRWWKHRSAVARTRKSALQTIAPGLQTAAQPAYERRDTLPATPPSHGL
jgi:lipopolysaccharide assembly protein A